MVQSNTRTVATTERVHTATQHDTARAYTCRPDMERVTTTNQHLQHYITNTRHIRPTRTATTTGAGTTTTAATTTKTPQLHQLEATLRQMVRRQRSQPLQTTVQIHTATRTGTERITRPQVPQSNSSNIISGGACSVVQPGINNTDAAAHKDNEALDKRREILSTR